MSTKCKSERIEFQGLGHREVVGEFNGGQITSDAGGLLLREVDNQTNILKQFAECFEDYRDPNTLEHTVLDLISQRVYALALGYEDLNDHDELRKDPLLAVLVGKDDPTGADRSRDRDKGKALAGKSTLNRLELTPEDASAESRYKKIVFSMDRFNEFLLNVFLRAHDQAPAEIVLDLDATDDPLHGEQEGRFFHGYYKNYCYLPLYIFCGDHLLSALLRRSNIDGSDGSVRELERLVSGIRQKWPQVRILVRGDSGFCRDEIMSWCEENHVDYVLGLAKNQRLNRELETELKLTKYFHKMYGTAQRMYKDFTYRTLKSWSCERRVIGKAEHLDKGANPRFVVTTLSKEEISSWALYERKYCARGEMENRIKEQQLYLFADRTSTATMRANQTRLCFSSVAYLLVSALRRIGLTGTRMEKAQCHTIRLKLFKIGARVRVTIRKVWVNLSSSYPDGDIFYQVLDNIRRRIAVPV